MRCLIAPVTRPTRRMDLRDLRALLIASRDELAPAMRHDSNTRETVQFPAALGIEVPGAE